MKHVTLAGTFAILAICLTVFYAPGSSASFRGGLQSVPPNFAYVSGHNFFVNGTQFHYGGDNIYWLGQLTMGTAQSEVDSEMTNCVSAGVKVVRTWAFSDVYAGPAAWMICPRCTAHLTSTRCAHLAGRDFLTR